jgi:hypothetical protein
VTDLPIACSLSADDLRTRRESLIAGLVQRASRIDAVDNGYTLRFTPAADLVPAIAQTIDAERQCCRFLRFDLAVEPGEGPVTLTITGPAGTREFLAELLDLNF